MFPTSWQAFRKFWGGSKGARGVSNRSSRKRKLVLEQLEERALLARVGLESGSITGGSTFQHVEVRAGTDVPFSATGSIVHEPLASDYDSYRLTFPPYDDTFQPPMPHFLGYVNDVTNRDMSFHAVISNMTTTVASSKSAALDVDTPNFIRYRINPTSPFEQPGERVKVSMDFFALLGALDDPQLPASATLDYDISYQIGDVKERFNRRANSVTGEHLYERIQRNLELEAEIGDEILIGFKIRGTASSPKNVAGNGDVAIEARLEVDFNILPIVDLVTSMVLDDATNRLDGYYDVFTEPIPAGTNTSLAFYWDTGAGATGTPAFEVPINTAAAKTVGRHSFLINLDALGTRPKEANRVLVMIDPQDKVSEEYEDNNEWYDFLPIIVDETMLVSADIDEVGAKDDNVFGTYLSGVKLPVKFKVTAADPEAAKEAGVTWLLVELQDPVKTHRPKRVKVIPGQDFVEFTLDPGTLAGDTTMFISALDKAYEEVGKVYQGTIKVLDKLPLDLKVEVPGQGQVDASELRLVSKLGKIAPLLKFTATAAGLPLDSAYENKLELSFVSRQNGKVQKLRGTGNFQNDQATILYTTAKLHSPITGSDPDFDVFLTPRKQFSVLKKPIKLNAESTVPTIVVVPKPTYLKKAKVFFTSGEDVQNGLDIESAFPGETGTAGYAFKFKPAEIKTGTFTTEGTPLGIYDDLDSQMSFGLEVIVYAKLTKAEGDATLKVGDWKVKLKLLGKDFSAELQLAVGSLKQSIIKAKDFVFSSDAKVDPVLLDGFASFTLQPAQAFDLKKLFGSDLKYEREIGRERSEAEWLFDNLPIPGPTPDIPVVDTVSFYLQSKLAAAIDTLQADAKLVFNVDRKGLKLDKEKSWAQVYTHAKADLTLQGGVSLLAIEIAALNINEALFSYHLRASVTMETDIRLRVNFEGKLLRDSPGEENAPQSFASLLYEYNLDYATEMLADPTKPNPNSFKRLKTNEPGETVPLFGLRPSPALLP